MEEGEREGGREKDRERGREREKGREFTEKLASTFAVVVAPSDALMDRCGSSGSSSSSR